MTSHSRDSFGELVSTLSPFERLTAGILVCVFAVSLFFVARDVSRALMIDVPAAGGTLTEGVIGSPRFINPLLAASSADRDLTALVYAGLMRPDPEGGLAPELAETYRISDDGLRYEFVLRDNIHFHDGHPVTVEDVVFTVRLAQDPALRSNKFANWEGVSVEAIGEREVQFTLPEPYAPFLENTTLGILPKHLWENASIEDLPYSHFNIEPVGAGPYAFDSVERNEAGIPLAYKLDAYADYARGEPHIRELILRFYRNDEELARAFTAGEIDGAGGITPALVEELADEQHTVHHEPLPRVFGVFFNKNRNDLFADYNVRRALALSLDRPRLVDEVLAGFGETLATPIPPSMVGATSTAPESLLDAEEAASLLSESGWQRIEGRWYKGDETTDRPLAFSLSTSQTPELHRAAELIAQDWRDFGADVELEVLEPGDLTNTVIRPRRYDALFFGEVLGRELDLFAFWHSSQRNDPGLNIAMYTNIQADALLRDARTESNPEARSEIHRQFLAEIEQDQPAIFTHAPDFIYLTPKELQNVSLAHVAEPSDRFASVHEWFLETNRVWTVFQ